MKLTEDNIIRSRDALYQATQNYCTAAAEHRQAVRALKQVEAECLTNGVEGKNQAARDAALAMVTLAERERLDATEDALAEARMKRDLAQLDVNCIDAQLRFLATP